MSDKEYALDSEGKRIKYEGLRVDQTDIPCLIGDGSACYNCRRKMSCEKYRNSIVLSDSSKYNIGFLNTEPLGLTPKNIWKESRLKDISAAMARYLSSKKEIPNEWVTEYNDLLNEINNERGNL